MANKKKGTYSESDVRDRRTAMPGTRAQKPNTTTEVKLNGKSYGTVTQNRGGVAGGNVTTDKGELKSRAKLYRGGKLQAHTGPKSAKAAEMRARNIEGHDKQTAKANDEIRRRIPRGNLKLGMPSRNNK